jgi:calpain-7
VGDYTVILSTFDPTHKGSFSVNAGSSHRIDFKAIPQEGAGMYNRTIRGAWYGISIFRRPVKQWLFVYRDEQTATGGPIFERYGSNPVFEVDIPSPTELK